MYYVYVNLKKRLDKYKLPWNGLSSKCDKTRRKWFKNLKQLLTTTELLVHYDPAKPISVLCYALPFIIVAILPQWMPNGEDRPIAFTAKALTSTERSFCHLEKFCHI